mgnify:CR=1 FL=1
MVSTIFQESVEEAVAQSLKANKVLAVYINSGNDEWLNKWFRLSDNNQKVLTDVAVWLQLLKGSPQCDYFEQIFPDVVVPSVYLVVNGQIKSVIQGEPSVWLWKQLTEALEITMSVDQAPDTVATDSQPQSETTIKKPKNETFKEQVQETSQQVYHDEVVKERKAEVKERKRILKLLEADKEERRAMETRESQMSTEPVEVHDNIKNRSILHTENCTLQIRLTNSETLTRKFKSTDTLNEVRTWVDVNRTDGDHPYAFHRNIPRMTFSESDEMKTLETLDLTPRSALTLQPLDTTTRPMNIAEMQQPGLLNKVYTGFSSWWGGETQQAMQMRPTQNASNEYHMPAATRNTRLENTQNVDREQSETNIASRSVTPNVFQLVNSDDIERDDKEKDTYNGNNISLEKNKDDK